LKQLEQLLIHASNTLVLPEHAHQAHAPTVAPSRNTSAEVEPQLLQEQFLKSNLKSTPTDPWKLDSQSTLISTTTNQESTDTLEAALLVATPSKSLVGELTTGSVPTLGEQVGEKTDSSELPSVKSELTALSMPANHNFEKSPNFNDYHLLTLKT